MKNTIPLIACVAVPMALGMSTSHAGSAALAGSSARPAQQTASPVATSGMPTDEVSAAQQKAKKRTAKSKSKGGGHLGHH
jgi:hypothetical protein